MINRVAILGASVRAAAFSALRAGLVPLAADLFADADLRACCCAQRVEGYPAELAEILPRLDAEAWMYTGALENRPQLVERLAASCRLLGNSPAILHKLRDPVWLGECLAEPGFRYPLISLTESGVPRDGSWLVKPFASAGGQRIAVWNEASRALPGDCYLQQIVRGEPHAAAFVAAQGESRLLGVTRQFLSATDASSGCYQYSGSLGPERLGVKAEASLTEIGAVLAAQAQMEGLFGIDFILSDGQVWLIEVNPRYTASMEVLERASGCSLVALHLRACLDQWLPTEAPLSNRLAGKRILYADRDQAISEACSQQLLEGVGKSDEPDFADIPGGGETIERGRPLMTLLASGESAEEVSRRLKKRAEDAAALLRV